MTNIHIKGGDHMEEFMELVGRIIMPVMAGITFGIWQESIPAGVFVMIVLTACRAIFSVQ